MTQPRYVVCIAALALLLVAPYDANAQVFKHSGTIVGLDRDGGRIVVAEVGPWRVREGATAMTMLTISLDDATPLALVERADETPSGFKGDFVEKPLEPWDLFYFDYVTVECVHRGGRMIALKVTVLTPEVP
jgi:hypothetical protein